MAHHEVTFPITDPAEILELRAGDEVTVQGHIIGIRDRTQIRIFDEGVESPMDLTGAFLLHTAPNVRKVAEDAEGRGKYEKICIGTTTSARMVRFTEGLGEQYGVRAICGKPLEVPRQGLRAVDRRHRRARQLALPRRPGPRPRQAEGALCPALTTVGSAFPPAPASPGTPASRT
jgi:tartrate dehydratase beta subunit/fumarate hydratase class I family protein